MISSHSSDSPLENSVDLAIVGGGLVGCMAAVEARKRGLSVVVIEKRAYLGREIAAYNHTFVQCAKSDSAYRHCPEAFRQLFRLHGGEEIVVPEGLARQCLMQILEAHGVPVLFESEPVGVSSNEDSATGLLLVSPPGLGWLPVRCILDATENANLLRLLSGCPYLHSGRVLVHSVFEVGVPPKSGVFEKGRMDTALATAEKELALAAGSVKLHPYIRNDMAVLEYAWDADCSGERVVSRSQLEAQTRQMSVNLALWLRENVAEFAQSGISHMAYECHIVQADSGVPVSPLTNVSGIPALPWGFSLEDVSQVAVAVHNIFDQAVFRPEEGEYQTGTLHYSGRQASLAALALEPYSDDALPVPFYTVSSIDALMPATSFASDVCVAGVGAGGGMAMLAAAERGCSVTALEVNRELGGTHTTGRVVGYYAGYREGANARAETEAKATRSPVIGGSPGGLCHAEYLRRKAGELDVRVLTGTRVCGVRMVDGAVTGVLAANEDGLFAVSANVTIDTTGDADVAALAKIPYDLGDEQDGMVQSYSMWGTEVYPTPSFLAQRYLTDPGLFHPDVFSERLRAITVAHRGNSCSHISPMLTPRESRRIHGEYSLRMDDILGQRVFPDALAVATTQTDSHAFASSDFDRLGGAGGGRPLQVRIPFGCFVPEGIEGLLVAAKAISGERDATCFCRMNADIKNAGYAVGVAAASAATKMVGVRQVDLAEVQRELSEIGVLPDWAFKAEDRVDTSDLLDALKDGGFAALQRVLYLPRGAVEAELERRYTALPDDVSGDIGVLLSCEKTMLCFALAWHHSSIGADYLAVLLAKAVDEGRHLTDPHLSAFRWSIRRGGDGDDDYTIINRLLVMAGRSGGDDVVPPLSRLVAETSGLGTPMERPMPYDRNRKDIVSEPFYYRLRNIAYAVERTADAQLAEPMETLLQRDGVTGYSVPVGSLESPRYMLAHLELWLARAAARCGSELGAEILQQYCRDTHVFFRRHAREELMRFCEVGRRLGT